MLYLVEPEIKNMYLTEYAEYAEKNKNIFMFL